MVENPRDMGHNLPTLEIELRQVSCMSWEEDPDVLRTIDDLFDSIEAPMTDFMRAIWRHHEDSPEWLVLSLVAGFVKNYNHARFVENSTPHESLQLAASVALSNPSLQKLVGDQLAAMTSGAVGIDE